MHDPNPGVEQRLTLILVHKGSEYGCIGTLIQLY